MKATESQTILADRHNMEIAAAKFAVTVQDAINAYKARMGFTYLKRTETRIRQGKRYWAIDSVEIFQDDSERHTTVVAFVDLTNGDVLKPATYKAPAKHARGNILSPTGGAEALTQFGSVRYL